MSQLLVTLFFFLPPVSLYKIKVNTYLKIYVFDFSLIENFHKQPQGTDKSVVPEKSMLT